MDIRRLARQIPAAGIALAALLLVACGEDAPPPITVTAPTSTAQATAAATKATTTAVQQATSTPQATAAASRGCAPAPNPDTFLLRVVDKQRGLPADYCPADLQNIDDRWAVPGFPGQLMRAPAAGPLVQLLTAAQAQGVELRVRSSYRTYQEQARTFQFWIDQLGEAQAKRESAPPGNSEHQLGTTADVISASIGWELIIEFGATPEGKWLAAHAHEFGFAISYPPDGETITGYIYEPWHIRYIGKGCSTAWKASGQVLVQFLERAPSC